MSWQNWSLCTFLRMTAKPMSFNGLDVKALRAMEKQTLSVPMTPSGWRVREVQEPVRGEWIEPKSPFKNGPTARTIFYVHGGGYFFGSPRSHRPITLALTMGAEARCFSLDYRLAPEHPFPAAFDDTLAAYRQLLKDGIPADRIVVAGDSAGGALVLAMMVALRKAKDPMPKAAVCFSPWTDLAGTGESLTTNNLRDPLVFGESLKESARHYLGKTSADHPMASPLYADLKGLPPILIHASEIEVLRDDSTRFAERARKAGVKVRLKLWRDTCHDWQVYAPQLPEAAESLGEASAFIREMVP